MAGKQAAVVGLYVIALQQQLRALFPGEDIRVSATDEAIILSGAVSSNGVSLRAAEIASCRYSARCELRQPRCDQALPQVLGEHRNSMVACWNPL